MVQGERAAVRSRGPADRPHRAGLAPGTERVPHAFREDPEARQGPVEADGVSGVDPGERRRRLARRREVGGRARGEAEVAGDPVDVGVHREEEARRVERAARPEAEVEGVPPHHPAEEEVGPLAGAPPGRGGEEEAEAARGAPGRDSRPLPERVEEGLEGGNVVRFPSVCGREERAEGALGPERRADGPEERPEGSGIDPPVDEPVEAEAGGRTLGEGRRRARAEIDEEAFERGPDRGDATEREGGGEERDDLAVRRGRVTVREEERVRVEPPPPVLFLELPEPRPERPLVGRGEPPSHRVASIRARGSLSDPPGREAW